MGTTDVVEEPKFYDSLGSSLLPFVQHRICGFLALHFLHSIDGINPEQKLHIVKSEFNIFLCFFLNNFCKM